MTSMRDALAQLAEQGRLTPLTVVEEARDPSSPLHSYIYKHDDTEAARRFRLDRAARLIRSFKVTFTAPDGERKRTRQYVPVLTPSGSRVYEDTRKVVMDPIAYQTLLRQMERDIQTFRLRYSHLKEYRISLADELARGEDEAV